MTRSNRLLQTSAFLSVLVLCDDRLSAERFAGEQRLTAEDIAKIIHDNEWTVVDTSPTDAWNGWALDERRRGGHIAGSIDFPARWLDAAADAETSDRLAQRLATKRITPKQHVVVCGTNETDCRRVASYLRKSGCDRLYAFDLRDWLNDDSRPLTRYANYQLLLPASIVKRLLEGQCPPTFEATKRLKFVEVSWGGENASYLKGHVPSSFHVNTDHFEPPPSWALGSPQILQEFATKYGFQADDCVIISATDPTAGYRLAVVLDYMGVGDVRVLNGGFAAWKSAGYPVETTSTPPPRAESFGATIPARPQVIDTIDQVKTRLKKDDFTLVDTRSWAEFTGKTSGYKYHFRKGRIPGSTYGQAEFHGKNSLTPYRNIDNTMRNADEIRELWRKSGIVTDTHLSFFCGGGWRAAEVLTFARVMGLTKTSLFSDGWIGWSNHKGNPVETGVPIRK